MRANDEQRAVMAQVRWMALDGAALDAAIDLNRRAGTEDLRTRATACRVWLDAWEQRTSVDLVEEVAAWSASGYRSFVHAYFGELLWAAALDLNEDHGVAIDSLMSAIGGSNGFDVPERYAALVAGAVQDANDERMMSHLDDAFRSDLPVETRIEDVAAFQHMTSSLVRATSKEALGVFPCAVRYWAPRWGFSMD